MQLVRFWHKHDNDTISLSQSVPDSDRPARFSVNGERFDHPLARVVPYWFAKFFKNFAIGPYRNGMISAYEKCVVVKKVDFSYQVERAKR
jgi:hypothetical protein